MLLYLAIIIPDGLKQKKIMIIQSQNHGNTDCQFIIPNQTLILENSHALHQMDMTIRLKLLSKVSLKKRLKIVIQISFRPIFSLNQF